MSVTGVQLTHKSVFAIFFFIMLFLIVVLINVFDFICFNHFQVVPSSCNINQSFHRDSLLVFVDMFGVTARVNPTQYLNPNPWH